MASTRVVRSRRNRSWADRRNNGLAVGVGGVFVDLLEIARDQLGYGGPATVGPIRFSAQFQANSPNFIDYVAIGFIKAPIGSANLPSPVGSPHADWMMNSTWFPLVTTGTVSAPAINIQPQAVKSMRKIDLGETIFMSVIGAQAGVLRYHTRALLIAG